MQTGSKEFALLCACAGVEISSPRAAQIAAIAKEDINWTEFLRLADFHGIVPLVARTLQSLRIEMPGGVRESLESSNAENLKRNLWFSSELARILEHFQKRNVTALPYKGPVLAESVYGDVSLRSFSDLDFLIAPGDFEAARQALAELEYQPSESWSPAVERFWLAKGYERSFDGKAGKYLVELQWAGLPYFFAVDLRNEDLLQRAVEQTAPARLSLSPEDSLLVLCLHAAKHLWMRLIWICDIAESMQRSTIDYSLLQSRAQDLGVERLVGVSFWLTTNLLGAELPSDSHRLFAANGAIDALGKTFAERLAQEMSYDFESPEYFLLIQKLRENRKDRCRYLWRLASTPGVGDLATVRLPEWLFPLYRLIRIGRLVRKLAES